MIHQAQNKKEILDILKIKDKIILLNFHSETCGPCIMQMPILEEISNDLNVTLITFDVDLDNDVLEYFEISSTPTTKIYKNGELKINKIGFVPYEEWKEQILKFQ